MAGKAESERARILDASELGGGNIDLKPRLARAYSEGLDPNGGASSPHVTGTPEDLAWAWGYGNRTLGVAYVFETCWTPNA